MKPLHEHRADQLEELLSSRADQNVSAPLRPKFPASVDAEVREMVVVARHLQASPSLKADPAFAQRLERKVLAHSIRYEQTKTVKRMGHGLFGWAPQMWVAFSAVVLCMLIGSGSVLAMAAGAVNPDNPLYGIKEWEQHVQLSFAGSPQNQAHISMQIIRDKLSTAASVADSQHAQTYDKTIEDIQREFDHITQIINAQPTGPDRQRLSSELALLQTDTCHTLYGFLVKLPIMEQLATTTLLGHLGASVPSIQQVKIVVASEQAAITVSGTNLTNTTRLVINNKLVTATCTLQQNTCIFLIPWHAQGSPSAIAALNEDNTIAQTTAIMFVSGNDKNESNNNDGNGGNNTNSTDKGNNGSGDNGHNHPNNNGVKPTVTSEAKPATTPASHG